MGAPVVISLIDVTATTNSKGDAVEAEPAREVMAERLSVRQSEFYQAQASGLRAELMFLVMSCEYQGERRLSYAGQTYNIIRTYERPDERTELICGGLVAG